MSAINCILVPVNELEDASILTKMRVFGIFTPDEDDKIMYSARYHYCVSHVRSHFNEDSLTTLDSDEAISDSTKKAIKTQYMKICSLAFLFGIGKECVRDKYNRLIPIDLTTQNQRNILENNNGTYSPRLVSEITDNVYECLNKLEDHEIISSDQKWELIIKYQDQLDHDDLILEEPEAGMCCCCRGPCNPCSQTCGACPRNGRLMAWGLSYIDQEGNPIAINNEAIDTVNEASDADDARSEITSECASEPDSTVIDIFHYNGEQVCLLKDVIKRYKDQFKGCLNPKKAIVKKNIFPHYIVARHKKQWVPCADVKERKARILISVVWVRANIRGFFQ
jgi:hypothetical protein